MNLERTQPPHPVEHLPAAPAELTVTSEDFVEGGQLPLQKRMPYKRGFTNIFAAQWEEVNLDRIAALGL